jgi:hypothetical protein
MNIAFILRDSYVDICLAYLNLVWVGPLLDRPEFFSASRMSRVTENHLDPASFAPGLTWTTPPKRGLPIFNQCAKGVP